MLSEQDEHFLRRALRLAMNGRGQAEPNPMVGCVLVRDGRVIGEGLHEKYGGPHAEPTALAACTESPAGATAYVTLEPCCHQNKKTPPCAPRLIEAGIARVVIGCPDPNPEVNGRGIAMLRDAGITVDLAEGPLELECKQLIGAFVLLQQYKRPMVTLKWAQTADGKVAGHEGMRLRITGPAANQLVHTLRSRSDAIIVGINTVIIDDPMLTARQVPTNRVPERIILDRKLRTPPTSQLVRTALMAPTVVVTSLTAPSTHFEELVQHGVRVVWPPAEREDFLLSALTAGQCIKKTYAHALVEAGPTVAKAFFKAGLCDRLWVFQSTKTIDDSSAPSAASIPAWFVKVGDLQVGDDTLTEYLNTYGPAYVAPVPSADFVLARESA